MQSSSEVIVPCEGVTVHNRKRCCFRSSFVRGHFMMSYGFDSAKSSLSILNAFYIALSVFLIVMSLYVKGSSIVTSSSIINAIIVVGFFLLFVSLLGLYGTSKHHQVALFFYMVILGLVFALQLCVMIACFSIINRNGINQLIKTGWMKSSNDTIWDAEKNFECCGLETLNDLSYKCDELDCARTACHPCLPIIVTRMRSNLQHLAAFGLFFSFTELFGIWLAMRYRNMKDPRIDPVLYFERHSSS